MSRTEIGAWGLLVAGFGGGVAGVYLRWGLDVALMVGGILCLWAGLRAARGVRA